jgi:hypothetical protein
MEKRIRAHWDLVGEKKPEKKETTWNIQAYVGG